MWGAAGIRHRSKHNLGDDLSFDDNSHSHIQSSAQHFNFIERCQIIMDTTKRCFKYFDGASKLTIKNMQTSEMKELVDILTKEIKFREDIGKEIKE